MDEQQWGEVGYSWKNNHALLLKALTQVNAHLALVKLKALAIGNASSKSYSKQATILKALLLLNLAGNEFNFGCKGFLYLSFSAIINVIK